MKVRMKMKETYMNPLKEVRKHITAALFFTLATVGAATFYAGIVLVVSDNKAIASLVFLGAVAVELLTPARWLRKRARQKMEKSPSPEAPMSIHGFISSIIPGADPWPGYSELKP